ncbi:hypothetical protein EKD16_23245 [Streptomonospora litoralis]|uniref:Uncharacterized protein n=1 Tax=Streptomonospora litoralis TaxID=2498135 RepID=A0A4V0ZKB5_9ACTN|nr:hypothetical protein EKD16_23245 [Streptomonospora litoralis]
MADGWACGHRVRCSPVAAADEAASVCWAALRSAGRRAVFTGTPQRGRRRAEPPPNGSGARRWRRLTGAATAAPGPGSRTPVPVPAADPLDEACDDVGGSGPAVVGAAVMQPDRGHEMHVRAAASAAAPPRGATPAPSFRDTKQCGVFCPPMPDFPMSAPRAPVAVAHEVCRMARKCPRSQLFVRLVATAPADAARKTVIDAQKPTASGGGAPGGDAGAQRATRRRPPAPDPAHHRGRASARGRAQARGPRPTRVRPEHGGASQSPRPLCPMSRSRPRRSWPNSQKTPLDLVIRAQSSRCPAT